MRIINFIGLFGSEEGKGIWSLLTQLVIMEADYDHDVRPILEKRNIYISRDQYQALESLINAQVDLDIGSRQGETYSKNHLQNAKN